MDLDLQIEMIIFESLLKKESLIEAFVAVLKIGLSQKSNHYNQVKTMIHWQRGEALFFFKIKTTNSLFIGGLC